MLSHIFSLKSQFLEIILGKICGHQNNPLIIAHDHGVTSSEVTKLREDQMLSPEVHKSFDSHFSKSLDWWILT